MQGPDMETTGNTQEKVVSSCMYVLNRNSQQLLQMIFNQFFSQQGCGEAKT